MFQIYLGSVWGLLRVALVFLWLVWGVFMVELGLIYMMLLKDHLQYETQYEKQKKGKSIEAEKQVSREAEKNM